MTEPKPPTAADSAEELAARARDGSRISFDELVVRYRPQLVAFLARRLGDPADAEDVAQETFLRAYDHIDRYDPTRPFATWLFAIGKNVAANHATARTRRDAREKDGGAAASASASASAGASIDDAAGGLWQRAANVLRPGPYRVLWLRYAQGMTVGEIARQLGRSSVAIKVMLFRARRRLLQEVR
ncbi:MAG TPA: sigma-70 family RNA polymerase sigma factor [Kofleriaceae bacterium]|nr:sigma-70 family RNA polymerase sigma factor [Kofleriaceae bacterium]